MRNSALFSSLGVVSAVAAYMRWVEPSSLRCETVEIPIPNLPEHLDGFRIAQLSDFHIGSSLRSPLRQAIAKVNELSPDLIVLTGDYVHKYGAELFDLLPLLGKMSAPHGIYAILGNHDCWERFYQLKEIIRYGMEHLGIPLLINQHVQLDNGLVVAGLDEVGNGRPNLVESLRGVSAESPVILLCHRPDYADFVNYDKRIILQLSGHTHGGQIRLPKRGPLFLPVLGRKYVQGIYRVGGMWLYVNRGIGTASHLRFRFRCPPELTLLTLRRRALTST